MGLFSTKSNAEKAAEYQRMTQMRRKENEERAKLERAREEYKQSAHNYQRKQELKEQLRRKVAPTRAEKIEDLKADTQLYKAKADNARAHAAYDKVTQPQPLKKGEKPVAFDGSQFSRANNWDNLNAFGDVNLNPFGDSQKKKGKKGKEFDGWFI